MNRRTLLCAAAGVAAAALVPTVSTETAYAATTATITGNVNLRAGAGTNYQVLRVLAKGQTVTLAGSRVGSWQPVAVGSQRGWVSYRYLSVNTSVTSSTAAPSTGTYSSTLPTASFVAPSGVTSRGLAIAREVYAHFPQAGTYGGYRNEAGSDHSTGHAIDAMLPSYTSAAGHALGDAIAAYVRANASRLGVTYVIWNQHIWNIARDAEGWRLMADRGSDTANHKDHVHISYS